MGLKQQSTEAKLTNNFGIAENTADEVISIEECKQLLGKFDLDDQVICDIRNYMIGIAHKTINSYLESFK